MEMGIESLILCSFFPGSEKHPDIAELLVDMSNMFLSNKTQLYLKEN